MTKTFALLTALSLGAAVTPSQAEISVEVFYNSLDSYGDWMEAGDYGYVWHPRDVDDNWRPYSDGNWAYTDAGWTWVSDEPHGWATYHYGRWARLENTGWVWVPGTEWGPAWVSWRRSERHVGWAPLPPEAKFSATVSIGNWADSYYDIGPANYTFVEVRNLGAPRLRTVILPVRENVTFIRETRNITNIIYQNNIVINEGPRYDDVVRVSAEPIRRLRLDRQTDFRDVQTLSNYRTRVEGDSLRIAAPAVAYNANVAPRRVGRKVENAQVNRGWRGLGGSQQEVERLRTTVRQEAQAPANLPAQPRFEREERSTTAGTATDANRTGRPAAGTSTAPGATSAQGTSSTAPDANTKTPAKNATTPDAATPPANTSETGAPPANETTRPGTRGNRPNARTGENAPATDVPGRPGRAARPDASSTTPDNANPADSTNRPGAKPDADSTKPDAANRPGRGGAENRPGSATTPDSKAPENKTPDASAQPDSAKPGRGTRPNADDSKNRPGRETGPEAVDRPGRNERGNANRPEAPGASATPGSPDPATTGRPEAPGRSNPANRPESPGRSDRPGRSSDTDATRSDSPSRAESPRNEKPERAERPNRPEPSERPNRPEPPARPEASSRPEAPKPESRQEKPAQAERQPKAERPSAEAARPEPQRAERAERPKAERPASAEQPKQPQAAARPVEQPKTAQARGGDDEKERGKKKE